MSCLKVFPLKYRGGCGATLYTFWSRNSRGINARKTVCGARVYSEKYHFSYSYVLKVEVALNMFLLNMTYFASHVIG